MLEPPRVRVGRIPTGNNLYGRLVIAHNTLPQILKFMPMGHNFTDPPELILDRFRLEILHMKAQCVLYRPFLGKLEFEKERKQCLEAAESAVHLLIPLVEASQPGGQLARCKVFMRKHVHDFNLAAMLLCSELKNQSSSNNSLSNPDFTTRVRPLLLEACALWTLCGVTSPKARHAMMAIEKFLLQDQSSSGLVDSRIQVNPAVPQYYQPDLNSGDFFYNADLEVPLYDSGGPQWDIQGAQISGTFSIEQDPFFRGLFAASDAAVEGYQKVWPR